ncbi:hypothetical protein [Crateriforma spongiae]|uniref:hypothetical protein n=1 Tax=Crateriforma spongiae TaxID=2724528 RepID=UPI00144551F1|nr:hypothetical protein [Crateriforma spongiae]
MTGQIESVEVVSQRTNRKDAFGLNPSPNISEDPAWCVAYQAGFFRARFTPFHSVHHQSGCITYLVAQGSSRRGPTSAMRPQCDYLSRIFTNRRFPNPARIEAAPSPIASNVAQKKIELASDLISQISKRFDLFRFDAAVMDERRAVS